MARAYKCDRCGTYYDNPADTQPSGFTWVLGRGLGNGIDLCADCCDKLSEWIEGERETLTEPKTVILGDTFLEEDGTINAEVIREDNLLEMLESECKQPEEAPQSDGSEEVGEIVTSEPDKPTWGDRAKEITRDYLNGMKRKDIAEKYGVKPRTVSNSIALFRKNHNHEYERMISESSAKNR